MKKRALRHREDFPEETSFKKGISVYEVTDKEYKIYMYIEELLLYIYVCGSFLLSCAASLDWLPHGCFTCTWRDAEENFCVFESICLLENIGEYQWRDKAQISFFLRRNVGS